MLDGACRILYPSSSAGPRAPDLPTDQADMRPIHLATALLLPFAAVPVTAQTRAAATSAAPARALPAPTSPDSARAQDRVVVTKHVTRIGGTEVRYTATTGTLVLRSATGKPRANVFFVAYTRDGQDPRTRPITFSYNGGPGAASIWLHMGLMGPKRVEMGPNGMQPRPPYQLMDNDESPLDVTDIVMIDPVQTGFSRAVAGEDPKQFTGVEADIASVSDVIRLYLTKFERWPSPKYLLGESYGTMRSAGVAEYLQSHFGVELNGIVLVSSILDYLTKGYAPGNDLPYSLFLPTFTATAWYHKKLPADLQGDLQKAIAESRAYALGDYIVALNKGNRLTAAERSAVAQKVARYTGLSPEFILHSNLRVTDPRFRKELLRDQGLTVGRLDGRFTGLDADAAGERQEYDPANQAIVGAYTALFSDYVRRDLGWQSDLTYYTAGQVRPWDYAPFENRYLNLSEELRSTMAQNPALHVMVANGYYDMATPFTASEHTFAHLGFEATYPERVSFKYYEGGHMMYVIPALRQQLKRDVAAFIASTKNVSAPAREATGARN